MTVLHTCWLTEPWKSSRDKYLAAWVKAGYEVVLWHLPTKSLLTKPPVEGMQLRDAWDVILGSPIQESAKYAVRFGDHGTASDLFRYEVLCQHGGAYADLDVWPKDATKFSAYSPNQPLFGDHDRIPLEIRFIMSGGMHPLMVRIRNTAVANEEAWIAGGGWMKKGADAKGILTRTAPDMAMGVVRQWAKEHALTLQDFILKNAVDEKTIEGGGEHFNFKIARARELAKLEPGYAAFKAWERAAFVAMRHGRPIPEKPLW